MDLITVDFETYYDATFSLSKLTTEEYIRSPMFEVIGVGVKVNDNPTEWASGSKEALQEYLASFNWKDSLVLAHNTMFDGAILNWHFGVKPKGWLDTLCMARALHGVEAGGSLKALAQRYNIGEKGDEVINAIGKRLRNFSEADLSRYGDYCVNDVELTHKLFSIMLGIFPKKELKVIDTTLRMFIEPVLRLDSELLENYIKEVRVKKEALLLNSGIDKDTLMSNDKFAELLRSYGVTPPVKISPATGKETYAFAKTDEEFKALAEHPDIKVQTAVSARLGTKSTIEETRAQRFLDISSRGKLPVPIKYYAAHTGRFGGDDKINLQNLPSRGSGANMLKRAILAPNKHVIIDADSSQIEARVLAWLAGQDDLVEAFARQEDVYVRMAAAIYGKDEKDVTKEERFVGKTTILGCGYGMGAVKFQIQLKNFGFDIELEEARRIINIYRSENPSITRLWKEAHHMLIALSRADEAILGRPGVLSVIPEHSAIKLPNGLLMRYNNLMHEQTETGMELSYTTRRGRTKIYGGKVVENVCQALARCIIAEQMLKIAAKYRVVLTVHDAIACVVKEKDANEAREFVESCMRWVPEWAKGLPVNCESGIGNSYGEC